MSSSAWWRADRESINVKAVRKEEGIARRILGVSFAAGFITISLSSASALAQTTQAPPSVLALKAEASPFAWSATENPLVHFLATDGQYHLEYQLLFVNAKAFAATLTSGEVLDPETETPTGNNTALSADGADVSFKWRLFANTPPLRATAYGDTIGKGEAGLMYFWLSYPSLNAIPSSLQHRFSSTATPLPGRTVHYTAEDDGSMLVSPNGPLVISPPLSGSRWFDAVGAGPTISQHRYSALPTSGALRVQEMFAIDWVKLDKQGRLWVGDVTKVENWFGYGQPITSATDGVVVKAVDRYPDQVPPVNNVPPGLEDLSGNRVIVATQNGQTIEYVAYAHLAPGSVAVKVGQNVRVGQFLGLLGNSGSSDGPHLHFQVSDAPSIINSNGLPFVINRFYYRSHVVGPNIPTVEDMLTKGFIPSFDTTGSGWRTLQMPLEFDVTDFPQQKR